MNVSLRFLAGVCALAIAAHAAPIQYVTVTDVVTVTTWTTVDAVATVWVSADQSQTTTTTSSVAQGAFVTPVDSSAGVFAPSATPTTSAAVTTTTTTTTEVVVAPQPTTTTMTTTTTTTTIPTTTTTTTPTTLPVTTQPTTPYQPTTTTSYAPATTTTSSGSAPAGPCVGQSGACTGDITHWDGGLGACGWNVNTDSDMQIALPVGLMGSLSNSNPYCGKSVSIFDPTSGVTIQATVGDKCMGCAGDAIDLTNAAFNAVTANQGDGRVHGIQWWFN